MSYKFSYLLTYLRRWRDGDGRSGIQDNKTVMLRIRTDLYFVIDDLLHNDNEMSEMSPSVGKHLTDDSADNCDSIMANYTQVSLSFHLARTLVSLLRGRHHYFAANLEISNVIVLSILHCCSSLNLLTTWCNSELLICCETESM